jgi:ABC-type thiamin/hydroxymethylpyrimidine transport system permease subunit
VGQVGLERRPFSGRRFLGQILLVSGASFPERRSFIHAPGGEMEHNRFYFSTRDLLMMSALAALGGVVSTYVNAVGDVFQSFLGFAGTTQWAAGLHVLWLTLAVGLTRKEGAGTVTGLLKGAVELFSGNTHGLLVVLIDIVAGLLVDVGFLSSRTKDSLPAFCLAGGLAAASNVFVFQLFASLPADVLAYGAMFLVGGMASLSGVLFAGLLGRGLVNALRRAGVVKDTAPQSLGRVVYPALLACAGVLTVAFAVYLTGALRGPTTVHVGGAVEAPFDYPIENGDLGEITAEGTLRGVGSHYTGIPVRELVARARPQDVSGLLLARGSDGYAFFISMSEVQNSGSLLLAAHGSGDDVSYDIVGAENSKAWVRGTAELIVVGSATLDVSGALENSAAYDPNAWQFEMDNAQLDVGYGPHKYQGVPLGQVLQSMEPHAEASTVTLINGSETVALPLSSVLGDDSLYLFTVIGEADVSFAVAHLDGEVVAPHLSGIQVQ